MLLGAVLPAAFGAPFQTNQNTRRAAETIPGSYIVTLKDGINTADFESHLSWVKATHSRNVRRDQEGSSVGVKKNYNLHNFNAYYGSFDDATLEEIRKREEVS